MAIRVLNVPQRCSASSATYSSLAVRLLFPPSLDSFSSFSLFVAVVFVASFDCAPQIVSRSGIDNNAIHISASESNDRSGALKNA